MITDEGFAKLGEALAKEQVPSEPQAETVETPEANTEPAVEAPTTEPAAQPEGGQSTEPQQTTPQTPANVPASHEEWFKEQMQGVFETPQQLMDAIKDLQAKTERSEYEKLVGEDEFAKNLLDAYRSNKLEEFLNAKAVDYEKVPDEQLARRLLKEEMPGATDEEVEFLFQRRYPVGDDEDEATQREARIRLKSDAHKIREKLKAEQANYQIPEFKTEDNQQELEARVQEWHKTVDNSPATKALSGGIQFKNGDQAYKYEVANPQQIADMAKDVRQFLNLFENNGQTDLERFYRVAAYATDPEAFEKSLIRFGQNLGTEKVVDKAVNPSIPAQPSPEGVAKADPYGDSASQKEFGKLLKSVFGG